MLASNLSKTSSNCNSLIIKFYNKIINDILSNKKIKTFDSIIICGGSGVLKNLVLQKRNKNIKICTLSHEDYLKEIEKSKYCILASGLGNFIESVGKNKNILYLPAINYSQLLQLEYYDKEELGFDSINWNDFEFYQKIPEFLDEESGVNMVVSNIKKYLEKDYTELVTTKLDLFFDNFYILILDNLHTFLDKPLTSFFVVFKPIIKILP